MKAKALNKISKASIAKLDRPLTTKKQVEAALLKYAKMGFTNTRLYFTAAVSGTLTAQLEKAGYSVWPEVDANGNHYAEIEWHRV